MGKPLMKFPIEDEWYKIGDEYFPVKDKENLIIFTEENCKELKLAKMINKINKLELETGRCYTNTERIVEAGKEIDVDIEFYSGWLFARTFKAIHHAWAVIKTKFGYQVLDAAVGLKELEIYKNVNYDNENWRDQIVKKIKKLRELPNEENMIMGKPPEGFIYIGNKDNKENAIDVFLELREKYPDHPSYSGAANMSGRSKLQEKMKEEGIK